MTMYVNQELCRGCGVCLFSCPVGALRMEGERAAIDEAECAGCQVCTDSCPMGAIAESEAPLPVM